MILINVLMPFFQCAELHGYIKPLLELLKGLKTGRYDKGNAHKSHTTFQELSL